MDKRAARKKDGEFLSTLAKGLAVMRAFSRERPEMTLSEVAAVTELSPAVARRCLNTLVELGYVGKQGNKVLLIHEVMVFASAFLESMNLDRAIRPHLQEVRDNTGDSSSLATLSGNDVLYLLHVSTNRMVRLAASIGTRFPAHATSLGRVQLAYADEARLKRYFDEAPLKKFTEKTVTSPRQIKSILRNIRSDGYATIQDELDYGIVSVAVPIRDGQGEVVAAINCSTATSRVEMDEMVTTRLPLLRRAAKEIEIELQRYPALVHSIRSAGVQGASA